MIDNYLKHHIIIYIIQIPVFRTSANTGASDTPKGDYVIKDADIEIEIEHSKHANSKKQ